MLLKLFYDTTLAQASYLIGCQSTGEALVVDPNRDVDQYFAAARAEGLRITHVTETHIHADYVSGSRELAQRAKAQLYLSDEGGPDWSYRFAAEAGAVLMQHGHRVMVGNIRIEALHTPGHTPEHMCFMVTDTPATDRPMGVLTGDCVFVGDVGRPDLLERAAGHAGTMEDAARQLFRSLQAFKALPDHLQVWPAHGAGSACGKALGAVPSSTIGYERIANWAFQIVDEDAFAAAVLAGQPEPPTYFAQMKRINRDGPAVLNGFAAPPRVDLARIAELRRSGAVVVDTRGTRAYGAGHLAGTLNVPLGRSFATYAGWLLPYDRDLCLLVDAGRSDGITEAVRSLALIGLDRVAAWAAVDATAIEAARATGAAVRTVPRIAAAELAQRMARGDVAVLDVRGRAEWEGTRLPGVPNIPYGHLVDRLAEVPRGRPLVLQCESGSRSAIAASVLLEHGVTDVINLDGGLGAWQRAGLPVDIGQPAGVV
jgi:hydroxyacylglutathione hydrolase